MRLAFFLLVLANMVFIVWAQGYLGASEEGREPRRMKEQLQPEKIQVTVQAAQATQAPPQLACRRIEGLEPADAEKLRQAFEAGGLLVSLQSAEPALGFLVQIPALANQAAADKKAGELKQLGIADFQMTQAGGSFAISLGSFADEGAAKDYLAQVSKKGVRSARVEPKQGTPGRASIEVRGAATTLAKRLEEAGEAAASTAACP